MFNRFIDIRSNRLAHVYRTTSSAQLQLGFIRGITVGDNWIAVAHSAGLVSSLELRTGSHLACWMYKGIEGEIQQVEKFISSYRADMCNSQRYRVLAEWSCPLDLQLKDGVAFTP